MPAPDRRRYLAHRGFVPLATLCLLALPWPVAAIDVAEIQAHGTLRLICFPFPSNEFVKPAGDGYTGLDVDIAAAFAKSLGVELEVVPKTGYGELIPALLAGEGDLVGSSFSITPARRELVDFSIGYFPSVVQVVTRIGSPIKEVGQLRQAQAATVPGSSLEDRLREVGNRRRIPVENSRGQFLAVEEGRAEFALADSTSVLTDFPTHPGLSVAFNLPGITYYGFAFRKDSPALREAYDKHLQKMRETGYIYQLVRRHFGEQGVALFDVAREKSAP